MSNPLIEKFANYPPNVKIEDADLQYLLDKTKEHDCSELLELWCMRISGQREIWALKPAQRTELFSKYSAVIAKLIHLSGQRNELLH